MRETKLEIINLTIEDVIATSITCKDVYGFVVINDENKILKYSQYVQFNDSKQIQNNFVVDDTSNLSVGTYHVDKDGHIIGICPTWDSNKGTDGKDVLEAHSHTGDYCLAKGTKITMADGSIKNIEDIKENDLVLTYNHKEGKYEGHKVYLAWKSDETKRPFTLHFEDDVNISVIGDHNFFEKESLSYVAIFEDKAEEFVGKHFYNTKLDKYIELLSVNHETEAVEYYEIYTEYNANCVAEDMLNCPFDSSEILNIYKFNEDLSIDHDQLDKDIKDFGIFEYKENSKYSKELYDSLNWKYINVLIGKGFGTMKDFEVRLEELLKLK